MFRCPNDGAYRSVYYQDDFDTMMNDFAEHQIRNNGLATAAADTKKKRIITQWKVLDPKLVIF